VDLLDKFLGQVTALQQFWMPFLVMVAIVGIGIWRAMEWRYGGTIDRLKERCEGVTAKPPATPIRLEDDPRKRALRSLKAARDSAAIALHQGGPNGARRAFHEAEAAMLNVKREFGIEPMGIPESAAEAPYAVLVEAYVSFIDRFYPLLREGHIEEAKERRDSFKWSWGKA
jgi:hypothetical protein